MKNKKGQLIVLKIMIAIIVLIMVMIFSQPVKESIDINTNTTQLNCSSSGLDSSTSATCIVMDYAIFYFIGAIISVSMAFIAGKKNTSGVVTGIIVFVLVNILINPLKDFIIYTRDASHLNCAAATSAGNSLACILIDLWLFWFVITVLAAAITFIISKKVLPDQ